MADTNKSEHDRMVRAMINGERIKRPDGGIPSRTSSEPESNPAPASSIEVPTIITDGTLNRQEIANQANPNPEIDDPDRLARNASEYHQAYLKQKELERLQRGRRDKIETKTGKGVISRLFRRN